MAEGGGSGLVEGKEGKESDIGGGGEISEAICVEAGGEDVEDGLVGSGEDSWQDERGLNGKVRTGKTTVRGWTLGKEGAESAYW